MARVVKKSPGTEHPWPAEQVELVPIKSLIPSARNARTHPPDQVEGIANLMLEHGWTSAVLRDEDGNLIAGHGRILGAALNLERGYERFAKAPVMTARGWSDAQKRAYMLADNQIALRAGWDMDLLRGELTDLAKLDYPLTDLGFTMPDLAQIGVPGFTGAEQDARAEDTPSVPPNPVTRLGDVWALGPHRLICGDSTNAATVKTVLGDLKPALMVTDPPYGVKYNPAWRHTAKRSTGERLSVGKHSMGKVSNDDRSDWREAWKQFPGAVAYVWHSGLHCAGVQESLEAAGFEMRSQIIWNKNVMIISRGHYHFKHEPCWYAVRKGQKANWAGDRKQTSVWDIAIVHATAGDVDDGKNTHGTQKPVECMRRPMLNNSHRGDAIYDPFLGSGTTLIAAQMEGRICLGVEIEPGYCDVIVQRWQKFASQTAVLTGGRDGGKTFEQLAKERLKPKGKKK